MYQLWYIVVINRVECKGWDRKIQIHTIFFVIISLKQQINQTKTLLTNLKTGAAAFNLHKKEMQYKNRFLRQAVLMVLFVGFGVDVLADSFEVDGISYITNTDDISVSVTKTSDKTKYAGKITIPSSVAYNSKIQ